MAEGGISLADAAVLGKDGGFGGNGGMFALLFLLIILGGWGGMGGRANAATQDQVQGSFNYSNLLDQNRDILNAVTNGTAQSVAATNQSFHDTLGVLTDKYGELARDIAGIAVAQQQSIANQNECCCATKMLIQENAAQNRYDAAQNTASINANMAAGFNSIREKLDQNKIEALQAQVNQLQMQQNLCGVVRYPTSATYSIQPPWNNPPPFPPPVF